jgi:hypothetical protein
MPGEGIHGSVKGDRKPAVKEACTTAHFQTCCPGELLVRGNKGNLPPGKGAFKASPQIPVESEEIFPLLQTNPVGRITEDKSRPGTHREVLQFSAVKVDKIPDSGLLGVLPGTRKDMIVTVRSVNGRCGQDNPAIGLFR